MCLFIACVRNVVCLSSSLNSHLRDILICSLTNEIAEVYDVDRRLVNLLAYTTYQPRAINPPTESLSGFVSNLNNSMMRCRPRVSCLRTHRGGLACSSRLYESQISKLSGASGPGEGQQNNRKLNEPYVGTPQVGKIFLSSISKKIEKGLKINYNRLEINSVSFKMKNEKE